MPAASGAVVSRTAPGVLIQVVRLRDKGEIIASQESQNEEKARRDVGRLIVIFAIGGPILLISEFPWYNSTDPWWGLAIYFVVTMFTWGVILLRILRTWHPTEPFVGLSEMIEEALVTLYKKATKFFEDEKLPENNESQEKPKSVSQQMGSIPNDVKTHVWNRDRGQCVDCSSKEGLEYTHIIPLSKGGSNTDRNLQILCERCNRRKGASI